MNWNERTLLSGCKLKGKLKIMKSAILFYSTEKILYQLGNIDGGKVFDVEMDIVSFPRNVS